MTDELEVAETPVVDLGVDLEFSAVASDPGAEFRESGFNEYGVRVNRRGDDGIDSVDVIFRAMEPGLRKNVRVTEDFLSGVASNFSGSVPFQYDHSPSQRANVGTIQQVWTRDGAFWLMGNIPNTGSQVRSDSIADFTHSPPAITDGSVGFGRDYTVEYSDDADEYVFVDAQLAEFSLTPFPAGYDNGGLSPAFCEAIEAAAFDSVAGGDSTESDAASVDEASGGGNTEAENDAGTTDENAETAPESGVVRATISDLQL